MRHVHYKKNESSPSSRKNKHRTRTVTNHWPLTTAHCPLALFPQRSILLQSNDHHNAGQQKHEPQMNANQHRSVTTEPVKAIVFAPSLVPYLCSFVFICG